MHDTGHLWAQVLYESLRKDVKGEYPGAGVNPISSALERARSLSSPCIEMPQCLHFVALSCYMALAASYS